MGPTTHPPPTYELHSQSLHSGGDGRFLRKLRKTKKTSDKLRNPKKGSTHDGAHHLRTPPHSQSPQNPNSSFSAVRPSQKIRMMTSLKRKELPGSTPTRFVLRSPQSPHNGGKWIFMRNLKGFTTTHRKNSLSTVETDVEKEFFRRELCGVLNFISI